MEYIAIVTKEGKQTLAEFPDCPGCQTFADPGDDIAALAKDALDGWLESSLRHGDAVRLPRAKVAGKATIRVAVDPSLAFAIQLRAARTAAKLTQSELAAKAGMKQQQIAKLEQRGNPTFATAAAVTTALGGVLDVAVRVGEARVAARRPSKMGKARAGRGRASV